MPQFFFQGCFVFLLVYAAISDYQRLKIPNWISLALCVGFLIYVVSASSSLTWTHVGWNVATGAAIFFAAALLYAFGIFGAGDVKLLGAIALWAGPACIVSFITLTGVLGGGFGLMILAARAAVRMLPALADRPGPAWNIARWGRDGKCPYGIPMAIAAVITGPAMFAG